MRPPPRLRAPGGHANAADLFPPSRLHPSRPRVSSPENLSIAPSDNPRYRLPNLCSFARTPAPFVGPRPPSATPSGPDNLPNLPPCPLTLREFVATLRKPATLDVPPLLREIGKSSTI